jgi:3-methylfumaryl-CoA hydratase
LDLALEQLPANPAVVQFRFRAVRPAFDSEAMHLCGKREGRQVTLWSAGHDNYVGMSARAMLGEYI